MESYYALINCELGTYKEVVEALKKIDGVQRICETNGAYDMVVSIRSEMKAPHYGLGIRKIGNVKSLLMLTVTDKK